MKKTKTILSVLLTAVMLLTMFTAVPFSASAADGVYHVNNSDDFFSAQNDINSHNSGTYDVYIDKSFESTYGFSVNKPVTVNFYGEGNTLTFTAREQSIEIGNGGTVNLGSLTYDKTFTIKGKSNVIYNDCAGTLHVWGTNSTCNMYDGVTIKDRKGNNSLGGGVTVESGTFNMYGGTIDNCGIDGGALCYGGGVAVYGQGRFIFNDGVISNCYAYSDLIKSDNNDERALSNFGGGIFVTGASTFIMNGGTVTKNKSTLRGGGIAVVTSNSEISAHNNQFGYIDSKVRINGGTITENESAIGGGICVTGNEFAYSSIIKFNAKVEGFTEEVINNNNSANTKRSKLSVGANSLTFTGDDVATGFNTYGGTVENNTATFGGGGMYIFSSRTNVSINNTSINSNIAKGENTDVTSLNGDGKVKGKGGGVYVGGYYGNTYINNSTIDSNTSALNGGGIAVHSEYGVHLQNTDINNNKSGDRGAGVYYHTDANKNKVYISGANTIQNNKFNDKLNNVNVVSTTKPLYVEGSLEGSKIGLSDPRLWDDNKTDAEAPDDGSAELLTNGYKANNPDVHPSEYFTSDHETWFVDYGEKKTVQGPEIGRKYTYTAKTYKVISRTATNSYASGDLIDVKAMTFSSGKADTRNKIYAELTARYKAEYTETATDQYKDTVSGSVIKVQLLAANMVHVNVDGRYIVVNVTDQSSVESGHLALRLYTKKDSAVFSDEPTVETVVLNNPISSDSEKISYNDIGQTVSKTVILKSTEQEDIQYETTTTDYTNEVRLVRKTTPVKFHDNKDKVGKGDDKLFRVYNAEKPADFANITEDGADHSFNNKGGVDEFYSIPKFAEDDYVFAGWYTVADNNDNDKSKAFEFNTAVPSDVTDVYAHWIPVGTVSKDADDDKELLSGEDYTYSGFGLFGVQIRKPYNFDANYGDVKPGGLRFVTSIKNSLLSDIDALSDKTVGDNNNKVEYGYVTAGEKTVEKFLEKTSQSGNGYKIQYNDKNVNGVDTTLQGEEHWATNYRYVKNVDCTAKDYSGKSNIDDHRNFSDYRLATLVIIYDDKKDPAANAEDMKARIVARAYIRYYDANGLLRTFYNDYGGTNVYGGCSTSFNTVKNAITGDIKTEVKK